MNAVQSAVIVLIAFGIPFAIISILYIAAAIFGRGDDD